MMEDGVERVERWGWKMRETWEKLSPRRKANH